jgi:hypothetical protein
LVFGLHEHQSLREHRAPAQKQTFQTKQELRFMTDANGTITVAETRTEFKQLVEAAMSEADLVGESGSKLLAALYNAAIVESKLGNSLFFQPVEQLYNEFET